MTPVEYMIHYFHLEPYMTKENLATAGYMLYFYIAMESGVGVLGE